MFKIDSSSVGMRVLAVMMAIALVATGAAALTTDTGTTDSAETSDLQSSTVIKQPHNSSVSQNIRIVGDSNTNTSSLANPGTEMTLEFVVNDTASSQDGYTLYSTNENWTQTTISAAPDEYNLSVSNEQFGDKLTYGAQENVTVDARITFNASETDESVHNITFTVAPEGENANINFDTTGVESKNKTIFGLSTSSIPFFGSDSVGPSQLSDNVSVTNNTTQITLNAENQSAVDSFSEVASSESAGDLATNGYVEANGHLVPMFVESADASWLDNDEAYATVSSDGSTVTIHNANATFDSATSSIDVSATGNEKIGLLQTRSMLSSYGADSVTQVSTAATAIDTNGNPFEDN